MHGQILLTIAIWIGSAASMSVGAACLSAFDDASDSSVDPGISRTSLGRRSPMLSVLKSFGENILLAARTNSCDS
jgi:hypothetical protein